MKNLHKTGNQKLANFQKNGRRFQCTGTRLHHTGRAQDHESEHMIVLDKFKVDAFLLESVQAHLNEVLPYLLAGGVYSPQELLGEDFWADMDIPRHLPLICLKHLAQQPGSKLSVAHWSGPEATYFEFN